MAILTIRHVTRCRYRKPVWFGEHQMMFRPRESFDQHVLESTLKITPEPTLLRFRHDVFGNCVGVAQFGAKASELIFESANRMRHTPEDALDQTLSSGNGVRSYPFAYSASDLPEREQPPCASHAHRWKVPGTVHGIDVDGQGNGTVIEQRLYPLIRQPKTITDRQFEIEFFDSGVEAFAFTFG